MRSIIERFYKRIFEDDESSSTEVPYGHKAFIFYISIALFTVVITLAVIEIARSFQAG